MTRSRSLPVRPKAWARLMPSLSLHMGKPEEIAVVVVFLASEEASYITGATPYMDGGWLAN